MLGISLGNRIILLIKRIERDWRQEANMNDEIGRFEIR
jgi:hypothetical protein